MEMSHKQKIRSSTKGILGGNKREERVKCTSQKRDNTSQWRIQDFPEEGAPTLQGERQHTNLSNFPKNCMKLKEFGPPGGGGARPPAPPLDPPLHLSQKFATNFLELCHHNYDRYYMSMSFSDSGLTRDVFIFSLSCIKILATLT